MCERPYIGCGYTKPDVSSLHVFGCSAYGHVPKAERHELNSKARKCVLLGYGTNQKGYHLYDLRQMKVVYSRDVVFDETSMPGIRKEEETTVKYVELEIKEEPVIEETATSNPPDSIPEESMASDPIVSESVLHRSTRNKQKPDRYSHNLTMASTEQQDPSSVAEAKSSPNKAKWEKAMEREMESLCSNDVWELVEPPPHWKIVGSKWIFKQKVDADGAVERYN